LFVSVSGIFAQTGEYSHFRKQAATIAASLDDSSLAAQVLLASIDGRASLAPEMRSLLERIPAGGILLFRHNLNTPTEEVKKLLSEAAGLVTAKAGIPPLMAVDHEGGLVHRFGSGVEKLPSAFSFWELALREGRPAALARAETLYGRSAREIRELGISMVLGPVVEILNEDNRLFLDTRSYGPDPDFVRDAASVFIRSFDTAGIASTLKHFPGNTAADPHFNVSTMGGNKAALDEMVKPFAELIRSLSPSAVMLSHAVVPVLGNRNASLSRPVIEGWLRGELGFEGIALADDYSMAAVAASGLSPSDAAVEALNSGIDMVMTWPRNMSAFHAAILEALRSGRLSRSRLREAAERIIVEKIRYGIILSENFSGGN